MAYFICPNCKNRSIDNDGREGLLDEAAVVPAVRVRVPVRADRRLLPGAWAGFVVCDREARVLATGRGVFELTGYQEPELIGGTSSTRSGSRAPTASQNPAAVALEWGVRRLGEKLQLRTRAGIAKTVTVDFFPAYDEDGGLLVASPRARRATTGRGRSARRLAQRGRVRGRRAARAR